MQATPTLSPASDLRRYLPLGQDVALVLISTFFFYNHVQRLLTHGSVTGLAFTLEQGLLVGMFLFRRRSMGTSRRPFDWIVATGSWLPLLMLPADSASFSVATVGVTLQVVGLLMTSVALLSLGRSFGIVAANRGLKDVGPYRVVRHPIYVGHFVTGAGFVLANASPLNLLLLTTVTVCQLFRIRAEERLLTGSGPYAEYKARVRWRLVPGLY